MFLGSLCVEIICETCDLFDGTTLTSFEKEPKREAEEIFNSIPHFITGTPKENPRSVPINPESSLGTVAINPEPADSQHGDAEKFLHLIKWRKGIAIFTIPGLGKGINSITKWVWSS